MLANPTSQLLDRYAPSAEEAEAGAHATPRELASAIRQARNLNAASLDLDRSGFERLGPERPGITSLLLALRRLDGLADPGILLAQAPREACVACGFSRAVVSEVHGRTWRPKHLHIIGHGTGPSEDGGPRPRPAAPDHWLIEADVIRRRMPALLSAPHVATRGGAPLGLTGFGYVVAPLLVGDRVIGLLHADHGQTKDVEPVDRETLNRFAVQFGLIVERFDLRARVRHHAACISELLSATTNIVDAASSDWPVADAPDQDDMRGPTAPASAPALLEQVLSPREHQVLKLISFGCSNRDIADQLNLAEATVKSHAKRVFRKVRANNRTEAAARYHALSSLSDADHAADRRQA